MNEEPSWLDRELVLWLHECAIERTGGSQGVRDEALLDSALYRPQNAYHYQNADIYELAAIYAEGISSNHPFVDGNKRTAFTAADLFLESNGYRLESEKENEQETLFLRLADGKVSREELAEWYRQHTTELEREQETETERKAREEAAARAERLAQFDRMAKEAEERRQQTEQTKDQTRTLER